MNVPLYRVAAVIVMLWSSALSAQTQQEASQAKPEREKTESQRPSLRIGNDAVRIDFKAHFQLDARSPAIPIDDDANTLDIARRRVGMNGFIGRFAAFQVEGELNGKNPWRDVYGEYRQFDAFRIQAGQFKAPFGLDETTSSRDLDFVYRSGAATQLSPGRDRGVMIHGRLWHRILKYEAGVFAGDGDHARLRGNGGATSGPMTVIRVTTAPFRRSKSSLADLRTGVAFTTGEMSEGISGLRGRTPFGETFFPATFWVSGTRRRTGFELQWQPKPFSFAAEYVRLTDERRGQGVTGSDLSPLVGTGWYVSGSAPLIEGRLGKVEVAARLEGLRFGSEGAGDSAYVSPRAEQISVHQNRVITTGINWYVNRWLKLQGNIIRESSDTAPGLLPGQTSSWSQVIRLQIAM